MIKKNKPAGETSKICPNGHVMDPSWDTCPYCAPAGQEASARAQEMKKTVVERMSSQRGGGESAGRKTVILKQEKLPPVVGWLVAINGRHKGEDYRIRGEQNIIGNDPGCQILLDDEAISGRHASIRRQGKQFTITDLDSSNGTEVNGKRITKVTLKDDDKIQLGETLYVFKSISY